ncbi:HGGxSTG domain-containing protein [Pseudonocardia sp. D17]|uniref:HGGxSTG domain-containing protein n=1 Tax=Pseudonocardia sp. D17 TaxID=882661 RepID=UPI0030CDC407
MSNEVDLSTAGAIKPRNQCVAHKKNGEQCQKAPIRGAKVCRFHGGAAKHVKAAAKARLENAADLMAKQLLRIAVDEEAPAAVKLAAIKDALDRAGLSPNQALQITHELKPYEQILERVARGPRPGSAPVEEPEVIEAELVEDSTAAACRACGVDFSEWEAPPGGYPRLCRECRRRSAPAATDAGALTQERPQRSDGPVRQPRDPSEAPTGGEFGLTSAEAAAALASEGIARPRRKRARQ